MQELDLDFRRTRSAPAWTGRVLLAVAIAFTIDVGITYYNVRQAVAQKELRLGKAGRALAPVGTSQSVAPEELAAAREAIQRLSRPWNNLFGALESTANDKVALLAIQPDANAGTVMISGESEDYAAVLAYVAALGSARTLNGVHLVQHELRENEKHRVAFSIAATWSGAR